MSVIFTLITPEFKLVYFIKTKISAPIFLLMTNECKGFQNPLFNLFLQEMGTHIDKINHIYGREQRGDKVSQVGGAVEPTEHKRASHTRAHARMRCL